MKAAAEQLGIKFYTLADWRSIRKSHGEQAFVGSEHNAPPADEKDRKILKLEAKLRKTERANEILKEALGFFAADRKK